MSDELHKMKTISDALFDQYQLGREHQRLAYIGKKREVGGEITKAKAEIEQIIMDIIGQPLQKDTSYRATLDDPFGHKQAAALLGYTSLNETTISEESYMTVSKQFKRLKERL